MNKKLNESAMQTELSSSAFFSKPATPQAEVLIDAPRFDDASERSQVPTSADPTPPTLARTDATTERRAESFTNVRPNGRTAGRRSITRYSFEFFHDQILELRSRALAQKLQGEDGSMSVMVREALDAYLALGVTDERPHDSTPKR